MASSDQVRCVLYFAPIGDGVESVFIDEKGEPHGKGLGALTEKLVREKRSIVEETILGPAASGHLYVWYLLSKSQA